MDSPLPSLDLKLDAIQSCRELFRKIKTLVDSPDSLSGEGSKN